VQIQNNAVGPGTYWLSAIDSTGCVAYDTTNIVQWLNPMISIIGDTNVCTGQETYIQANTGFTTYQWSNGLSTANVYLGAGDYTLTVTDSLGCQATSDTIDINDFPTPVVNISGILGTCVGDATLISASPNFTNYQWNNGVQTQNNFVGPGSYSVSVTDTNGCVANDTTTIIQWPNPVISLIGDTNVCTGLETYIQANPGFVSYQWSNGLSDANVFLGAGVYTLTVVDSLGCQATDEITVIASSPTAAISVLSTGTGFNSSVQWQSNATVGLFPISSWLWNFGDGSYSNQENPSHIYTDAGNYTVNLLVTDELGCTDSTSYFIELDPGFAYYIPNSFTPDGDNWNQIFLPIFSAEIDPYNYQMLIYNRWGEIIFETLDPIIGWDGSFSLDGNSCQTGTYTYMITINVPVVNERKIIRGHVNLLR
jgi:gliding motility-associated-like protein